jgi:phenylalanyl-tRNA synthetase beta chain
MRTTLVPSLLETTAYNLNYRQLNQRIFELRRLYLEQENEELPNEPLWLGTVLTGAREADSWCQNKELIDFYDTKGLVEELLAAFNIQDVSYDTTQLEPFYHPGKSCTLFVGKKRLGSFGEIHPDVQANFGLSQAVYYLEISFDALLQSSIDTPSITAPSRYPDICRDVALLLADTVLGKDIIATVSNLGICDLVDVNIFDVYHGEHVPEGHKSVAVRLRYQSHDRTLTDDEVGKMHQKVVNALVDKLNAKIR